MPTPEEVETAGRVEPLPIKQAQLYPAQRDQRFTYGRTETDRFEAARFTNFYEFASSKDCYKYVASFQPTPWSFEVTGLCSKPRTFDLDDVYAEFSLSERAYRHRCVETWAMCVPWTGFPLRDVIAAAEPLPSARFVELQTVQRPEEMPGQRWSSDYPWPYTEGLTLPEATNELTFVATGIYGAPLPKQHGAPIRVVIPWKYGYKSIKSIVKIRFVEKQPPTTWGIYASNEYGFYSNVNPKRDHPRWSQARERRLGEDLISMRATLMFNGYEEQVAGLYSGMDLIRNH
jgi:sulfoxide reductase catalytic subunit YedY